MGATERQPPDPPISARDAARVINIFNNDDTDRPQPAQPTGDQDAPGDWRDWLPNWIIAIATLAMFAVANAQRSWAKRQAIAMDSTLDETRKSADAAIASANTAADALRITQRARLSVMNCGISL